MQERYPVKTHCRPTDSVGKSVPQLRCRISDHVVGTLLGISSCFLIALAGALAYITSVSLLVRLTSLLAHIKLNLGAS
jgi:hypothetical protein